MPKVVVVCDRCHETVHGLEGEEYTAGFYRTELGTYWQRFANPGENVVCDACMGVDPRYQQQWFKGVGRDGKPDYDPDHP
jgi:hypothetical protein